MQKEKFLGATQENFSTLLFTVTVCSLKNKCLRRDSGALAFIDIIIRCSVKLMEKFDLGVS